MAILLSADNLDATGFLVMLRADGWHVSSDGRDLGIFNSRGAATEEACARAARNAREGSATLVVVPGEVREIHSYLPTETPLPPANDSFHAAAMRRT